MAESPTCVLLLSRCLHTVPVVAGARGAGIPDARSRDHRGGHLHVDLHRHDPGAAVVSRAAETRAHLSSGGSHGAARVSAAAARAGGGH